MKIFFLMLFVPMFSFAAVKVAFLEMRDAKGNAVALEPGGRFAHLAIAFEDQWLHAHPFYGVQLVSIKELEKMGPVTVILELPNHPDLTENQIKPYLGAPFDPQFSWTDEKIYCSELVGKVLGLRPEPMDFSLPVWPAEIQQYHGQPGLSPDDIFRKLSTPDL